MLTKLLLKSGISFFVLGLIISLKSRSFAETVAQDTPDSCITQDEIVTAQETWGDGIVEIGNAYQSDRDYQEVADNLVTELYDYDEGKVLFKPTKASEDEFRLDKAEAVSYFVKGVVPEDDGLRGKTVAEVSSVEVIAEGAIQPWSKVRFENAGMILDCDSALSMGDYYFTDANTGEEVKAEYSLGYRKNSDSELHINLHHSSFPYEENE